MRLIACTWACQQQIVGCPNALKPPTHHSFLAPARAVVRLATAKIGSWKLLQMYRMIQYSTVSKMQPPSENLSVKYFLCAPCSIPSGPKVFPTERDWHRALPVLTKAGDTPPVLGDPQAHITYPNAKAGDSRLNLCFIRRQHLVHSGVQVQYPFCYMNKKARLGKWGTLHSAVYEEPMVGF